MVRPSAFLCVVAVLWCLGCSPPAQSPESKTGSSKPASGSIEGLWEGKPTGQSSGLAESLGGYKIRIQADGMFLSEMRGLVREGQWKLEGDRLNLATKRVFGKTKEQAEAENKEEGRKVNDLALFDQAIVLVKTEDTLTLKAASREDESVVFRRAASKETAK